MAIIINKVGEWQIEAKPECLKGQTGAALFHPRYFPIWIVSLDPGMRIRFLDVESGKQTA